MIKIRKCPIVTEFVRLLILVVCAGCLSANSHAQSYQQISPGIDHAEVVHMIGSDPVRIQLLRIDLSRVRLDVVHAQDKAIGLETTSQIAKSRGAAAAINAGFFRLDRSKYAGDAAGLLMIDGKLLSESSRDRAAVGIINGRGRTAIEFGHFRTQTIAEFGVNDKLLIDGVNRERKPADVILYTPEFGETTMADAEGTEIVLSNCGSSRDGIRTCRGVEVSAGKGGATIPANGYVLSIANDALERSARLIHIARTQRTRPLSGGTAIRVITDISSADGSKPIRTKFEDITNGVSLLIRNGKIDVTWQQEKAGKAFAESRHPRTAIAKLKDGRVVLLTADGRQPGVSVGMNLYELAAYLLSLGAVDAMNLDGGGSTTMFLDGKVVNKPSDKEGERRVGDAILVTLRNKQKPERQ